jgi:predicted TPR repeat methyltransferase
MPASGQQALIQSQPDFAAAFNNLGTIYYANSEWQAAANAFQSAIDKRADYVDAYYNLGLTFNKLKKFDNARHVFESVVALDSVHVGAVFQLASLLMQQRREAEAVRYFKQLTEQHPFHLETIMNLAACYLRLGQWREAKSYYLRALEMMPEETQILFNLGVIEMENGDLESALQYYLRVVGLQPDFYPAHYNLGKVYLLLKRRDQALLHYQEALRLQPDNETVKHMLAILSGDLTISGAPSAYLQSLFDSYAGNYDSHLASLHYQVPSVFYQLIMNQREAKPVWDVLDLGCGTGLCGQVFKSVSQRLVGVDVSEKMLAVAESKHCYDELVQANILTFLTETRQSFDLVIAADVLVYVGELDDIFKQVHHVLREKGLFIFNLEINTSENWVMTASGRFAHRKSYIDQCLKKNGWVIVNYHVVPLREQDRKPLQGHVYLCSKAAGTS